MENDVLDDPQGYARLARALDFLVVEAAAAGVDSTQLRAARNFSVGSPTEFLGESLLALEMILRERHRLPPSVATLTESVTAEIRDGFERLGGG